MSTYPNDRVDDRLDRIDTDQPYDPNDPEQIRREIEVTRGDLSDNVNALAESVRPGNVARRQVDRVKEGASDLKDRVMGAADDASSATSAAPSAVRRRTRGNPVAAGLVAFGLGWLVASLIPASSTEQQAATALKDKAQPVTDEITQSAKQVAENLKEPAQHAAAEVKDTAAEGATTVKEEARVSAQSVGSSAQDAAGEVRARAGSSPDLQ